VEEADAILLSGRIGGRGGIRAVAEHDDVLIRDQDLAHLRTDHLLRLDTARGNPIAKRTTVATVMETD
jgi:hypothetical protein